MTTAADFQANGKNSNRETIRRDAVSSTARFEASLAERISPIIAGVSLSLPFGLTAMVLHLAMRT